MVQAWLVTPAELEFANMRQRISWQKIINFLTKEELEAAHHLRIYEQHNSKQVCSQDTHRPLPSWEVK